MVNIPGKFVIRSGSRPCPVLSVSTHCLQGLFTMLTIGSFSLCYLYLFLALSLFLLWP